MKKWWIFFFCAVLAAGCVHREHYSEVPHIEFVRLEKLDDGTGRDNQANLVIAFQDGDGDIGLSSRDTTGPFAPDSAYYYNFFIDFIEKQHGEWVVVDLPTPLHARVPYLSEDVPESIEGELTILTFINNYFSPYDTIMLRCRLVDRALHESNIIETPEIIVKK
ncbi:MAG: hypothetical protein K5890_12000 [Bacteroidales bacterium]|nr:hypothetical protein [Bacteroidales bacterium]